MRLFSKEAELSKDQIEHRRIQKELERESKWIKMLEEWKQRHPAKLPERIWKGIPDKLRLVVSKLQLFCFQSHF